MLHGLQEWLNDDPVVTAGGPKSTGTEMANQRKNGLSKSIDRDIRDHVNALSRTKSFFPLLTGTRRLFMKHWSLDECIDFGSNPGEN